MSCNNCKHENRLEKDRKERNMKRKLYESVKEGETPRHLLYEEGQPEFKPLILADDEEPEHVVAIIEDSMRDHRIAGAVGKTKKVVKGKCHHCGSNRVISQHKEPEGIGGLSCPVCGNDEFTTEQPAKLEIKRGDEK